MLKKLNDQLRVWLKKRHVKSFYISVANTSLRQGAQALIQTAGLGKLRPNVLAMGFKEDWVSRGVESLRSLDEYFGIIQDAFDAHMGIMILRTNAGGLDFSEMMTAHNLGDTSRLQLPEISPGSGLRPNASERSLPGAAAALSDASPLLKRADGKESLPAHFLNTDSSQLVDQLGLKDDSSKGLQSASSKGPSTHPAPLVQAPAETVRLRRTTTTRSLAATTLTSRRRRRRWMLARRAPRTKEVPGTRRQWRRDAGSTSTPAPTLPRAARRRGS